MLIFCKNTFILKSNELPWNNRLGMELNRFKILNFGLILKNKENTYNCSYLDEISISGLFLRSKISVFQKSLSRNYTTLKKIFSYSVIQPMVTNIEYNKLKTFGFFPLEATSDKKMLEELKKLVEWSNSNDFKMQKASDEIFNIRVKELKYFMANTSPTTRLEFEAGYFVLEKFLEFAAS